MLAASFEHQVERAGIHWQTSDLPHGSSAAQVPLGIHQDAERQKYLLLTIKDENAYRYSPNISVMDRVSMPPPSNASTADDPVVILMISLVRCTRPHIPKSSPRNLTGQTLSKQQRWK